MNQSWEKGMEKERDAEGSAPAPGAKAEGGLGEEDRVHRRILVRGRVQGVFFRAWTRDTATELGLQGIVRNLPDGSVEILAGGPREAMEVFQRRLWQGPPAARVEEVEVVGLSEPLGDGPFRIVR